jgi:hypothetical protein
MYNRHDWRQDGQQGNLSNKTFSSLVSLVVGRIDLSIRLHIYIITFIIDIDIFSGRFCHFLSPLLVPPFLYCFA